MNFVSFTASSDDNGRRFDRVLKRLLTTTNNSLFHKYIRKGLIKLNNRKVDCSTLIKKGDKITVAEFLNQKELKNKPEMNKNQFLTYEYRLETVFRNDFIWIINKPYNMPVQPSKDSKISLAEIVSFESITQIQKSLSFRPGPLHRLDRYTTGLLAFSQNTTGAKWFSESISGKETDYNDSMRISKTYIGIVEGNFTNQEKWEDDIDDSDNLGNTEHLEVSVTKESVANDRLLLRKTTNKSFHTVKIVPQGNGKRSVTEAIPLSNGSFKNKNITLVQFNIFTGRKHQIRAQSSFHGYPLLGDSAYGGEILRGDHSFRKFYLHAIRMRFPKENPLELPEYLEAPLPRDFKFFLDSTLINWNGDLIL